jgi:hypothetical protein
LVVDDDRPIESARTSWSTRRPAEGPYVVLHFETDSEAKEDALETITPAPGKDDRWGVAGYFIQ